MGAQRAKIEDIIADLDLQIGELNQEIDAVNEQIRANERLPAAREEIEAALRAQIAQGAERYREKLKFRLGGHQKIDSLLPVQNFTGTAGVPIHTDFALITDGFHFLASKIGDVVINDLIAMAPTNRITAEQKKKNDSELKAKKRQLETRLEQVYLELESAGFKIDRRPDLSPEVFLEFESKDKWNRRKLDAYREGRIEQRGVLSRLTEQRNGLIVARSSAEDEVRRHQNAGGREYSEEIVRCKAAIDELANEQKALDKRIEELRAANNRQGKLWNTSLDYLRSQGVTVDPHL